MDERRTYPREELTVAMICEFVGDTMKTHCVVKNVSLDGALLECPMADGSDIDIGDAASLRDIVVGDKMLFDGQEGTVAWIYKRFIGVHFGEALKDSPELLLEWLQERNLG